MSNENGEKKRFGATAWLNAALACLLGTILCGFGATYCVFADVATHSENDQYFDAKLVWERNDGTISAEGDDTNRIVPSEDRTVAMAAQNVGNDNMFPRVKVTCKWVACEKSADGTTFTKVKDINSEDAEDVSNGAIFQSDKLSLAQSAGDGPSTWVEGDDGYYYYAGGDDPVAAGATTESLQASVMVSGEVGDSYNDNTHHELSAEENRYIEYNADGTEKATYYTGVEVQAQLEAVSQPYAQAGTIAKTGDALGPLAWALIALTLFFLVACLAALLAGKMKKDARHLFTKAQVDEVR